MEIKFSVIGSRITCSDGRWWELQESPDGKRWMTDPYGIVFVAVKAISGGVKSKRTGREYPPASVTLHLPVGMISDWRVAQGKNLEQRA